MPQNGQSEALVLPARENSVQEAFAVTAFILAREQGFNHVTRKA